MSRTTKGLTPTVLRETPMPAIVELARLRVVNADLLAALESAAGALHLVHAYGAAAHARAAIARAKGAA